MSKAIDIMKRGKEMTENQQPKKKLKLSIRLKNWIEWKLAGGFTLHTEVHDPMNLTKKGLEFSEDLRLLSVEKVNMK